MNDPAGSESQVALPLYDLSVWLIFAVIQVGKIAHQSVGVTANNHINAVNVAGNSDMLFCTQAFRCVI